MGLAGPEGPPIPGWPGPEGLAKLVWAVEPEGSPEPGLAAEAP